MLRKAFRFFAALVLFTVIGLFCAVGTAFVEYRMARRLTRLEARVVFNEARRRGDEIVYDHLSSREVPADAPAAVPPWRSECVVGHKLLVDVSPDDLAAPSIIEGAADCLKAERPDESRRD